MRKSYFPDVSGAVSLECSPFCKRDDCKQSFTIGSGHLDNRDIHLLYEQLHFWKKKNKRIFIVVGHYSNHIQILIHVFFNYIKNISELCM